MSQLIRSAFVRVDDGAPPSAGTPRTLRYSMRSRARQRAAAVANEMEARAKVHDSLRASQAAAFENSVPRPQRGHARLDDSLKLTRRMQQDENARLEQNMAAVTASMQKKTRGSAHVEGRVLARLDSNVSSREDARVLGRKDSNCRGRAQSDAQQQSAGSLPSLGRALRPPTAPVRRPSALARGRSRQATTLTAAKLHAAELKRAAAVQAAQVAADARGVPRDHSAAGAAAAVRACKRADARVRRVPSSSSSIFTPSAIQVKGCCRTTSSSCSDGVSGMFSDAEGDVSGTTKKTTVVKPVVRVCDLDGRDWSPVSSARDTDASASANSARTFVTAGPTATAAALRAAGGCSDVRTPNACQMDVSQLRKATVGAPVSPAPRRFAPVQTGGDGGGGRAWGGGSERSKSLGLFAKRARGRVRSALGPMPPTHTPNVKGRWARRNVSEFDR